MAKSNEPRDILGGKDESAYRSARGGHTRRYSEGRWFERQPGRGAAGLTGALFSLFLAGCAAPGSPLVRTEAKDGEGPLIAGCQNVSSRHRVNEYITHSYLSTTGSAFMEGTTQGLTEGLQDANQRLFRPKTTRQTSYQSARQQPRQEPDSLTFRPTPFCRGYAAPFQDVTRAVKEVLPLLGNPITASDEQSGYFETDFIGRSHAMAEWRDRYVMGVDSETPGLTTVRVVRLLYISRLGQRFNQAVSVGHNEAWFMTQIDDKLAAMKRIEAATPPPAAVEPKPVEKKKGAKKK